MSALGNSAWRRWCGLFAAVLLLVTALLGVGVPKQASAAGHTFTVILQAGHSPSAYGVGNTQNGRRESVLNEEVTIKTYNALKARGINVLLMNPISLDSSLPSLIKERPAGNVQYSYYSPEPAMLTALTWPERFDPSITHQADLVISLHHNAYSNPDIRGYEIYYASTVGGDYGRTTQDVEGSKKIAKLIEAEFRKGFHVPARSPAVRDNTTNNGLTKSSPMPAVLIEAGYMSNKSDLNALVSDNNQQSMADKIADAVVNFKNGYWTEQDYVDIRTSSLTATFSEKDDTISIKTALTPADKVAGATMQVWPESLGADSAKTYELTDNGDGQFSARIGLEPFGFASGTYCISVHGRDEKGRSQLAGTTEVKVNVSANAPSAASVTAKLLSSTSDSAILTVSKVSAPAGIDKVQFAVWSEQNGQDDLEWYTATQSGNDWVATMRTSDMLDRPGEYIVHAYVTDKHGQKQMVGDTTVTFQHKEGDIPELFGDLTYRKVGTKLILTASDVRDASGVQNVRFAFWSTENEQRDMQWYNGQKNGGTWSTVVGLNDHPSNDDRYTVHVYATDSVDNDGCIAALSFRLGKDTAAPTARRVTVVEQQGGTAAVYVEGVKDDYSGVSGVELAVWTQKKNQDDLKWYRASLDEEGNWTAKFSRSQHKDEEGPYHIVAYATDAAGNRGLAERTKFTFTGKLDTKAPTGGILTADRSTYTGQNALIKVIGLNDSSGVESVSVEVSRPGTGKTLKTYEAELTAPDTWTVTFNWGRDFGETGEYLIKAFATDRAGNKGSAGETKVRVESEAIAGTPIMGKSQATLAQLVNMQLKYGWNNGWYKLTVEQFCQKYLDVCEAEGVRAEVAYAQMLHETGGLRYGNLVERSQLNFAGLGATGIETDAASRKTTHRYTADGRDAGIVFKSVDDGIKSQVQHLKGYACKEALNLPMAKEYDRFGYMERGCAPTLQMLSQKWATDEAYGDRMCEYVDEILSLSTKMPTVDTTIPEATEKPSPAAASAAQKPGTSAAAPEEDFEADETDRAYVAPIPMPDLDETELAEDGETDEEPAAA